MELVEQQLENTIFCLQYLLKFGQILDHSKRI